MEKSAESQTRAFGPGQLAQQFKSNLIPCYVLSPRYAMRPPEIYSSFPLVDSPGGIPDNGYYLPDLHLKHSVEMKIGSTLTSYIYTFTIAVAAETVCTVSY